MAERATEFDALIVGAGHNGLVAACYLAGAGLKCACSSATTRSAARRSPRRSCQGSGFRPAPMSSRWRHARSSMSSALGTRASSCWSAIRASSPRSRMAATLTCWNDHEQCMAEIRKFSAEGRRKPTTTTTTSSSAPAG